MADYARRERSEVADLLLRLGPDAPTLCTGWNTRDLAAHLVVRERRPDAALSGLIAPLAGHGEHVRKQKATEPYDRIVAEVRTPPWWSPLSNPVTDELANALEFFIHHEDIRRAAEGWTPRVLDAGEQKAIWRTVRLTAKLALGRLRVPLLVRAPGFGELTVGENPQATLTGEPGELALFVSGRQRVAQVTIEAPDEVAERLRTAKIGI